MTSQTRPIDLNNTYVLVWSYAQQCFHIDTLMGTLIANWNAFIENKDNVWIMVGIFNTSLECFQFLHQIEKSRRKKKK